MKKIKKICICVFACLSLVCCLFIVQPKKASAVEIDYSLLDEETLYVMYGAFVDTFCEDVGDELAYFLMGQYELPNDVYYCSIQEKVYYITQFNYMLCDLNFNLGKEHSIDFAYTSLHNDYYDVYGNYIYEIDVHIIPLDDFYDLFSYDDKVDYYNWALFYLNNFNYNYAFEEGFQSAISIDKSYKNLLETYVLIYGDDIFTLDILTLEEFENLDDDDKISNFEGTLTTLIDYSNGKGYSDGYNYGYNYGFMYGASEGEKVNANFGEMILSILDAPRQVISNILNFEFLGVNLSSLVFFLISCALVVAIVKFFL